MTELGTILEEARLELGLTIEDMAERTKIRSEFLVAIEQGEFDKLPGEAYVRPFIRTYARALGLEEEQIILELDLHLAPTEEEIARVKTQQERLRIENRNRIILRGVSLGVVILGVAFLLFWLLDN